MLAEASTEWISAAVGGAAFQVEAVRRRPWATTAKVVHPNGVAWFKACAPVQQFECGMTAALHGRWPDRVADVLAVDGTRGWLLLADAGTCMRDLGNDPLRWLSVLPEYAELQRGEAAHVDDHLANDVPDLRVATLPHRLRELATLPGVDAGLLARFEPVFTRLCLELHGGGVPASVQHEDLHDNNVFCASDRYRVLDWGDASVGHPFFSMVVPFRFLEQSHGVFPGDPWWRRVRDAYLEPWGRGWEEMFELAVTVGSVAHLFAWVRQREALRPDDRGEFDAVSEVVTRRASSVMELLA